MKTEGKYILNSKDEPVEETDLIKWANWFETSGKRRQVASTEIEKVTGLVRVSTVFLGLDYAFVVGGHTPILYETMIFGGKYNNDTYRYHTRQEALEGHERAVKRVKTK